MATYEDLCEQFRQINKKAQRIWHQNEMLTRRLPIARTSLETLAKGDYAPDVQKIANEALNELTASSVKPEELSLFLGADAPTPPVDVKDLKRFRELLESLAAELDVPADSNQGPKSSIAMYGLQKLVESACGPGANASALNLRNGSLEMFLREGYLAPLQSCMPLDDAMLRAIATIPFNGPQLKPEVFVQRLREEGISVSGTADRQFASSGNEADRYRRLQHHYRLMNADVQQSEFASDVLNRQMATAQGALETIANGGNDQRAQKLARETLDGFRVLSEPERFMAFFQGVQDGAPIPPVEPADMLCIRDLYKNLAQRYPEFAEGKASVGVEMLANACRPGANVLAVGLRYQLLWAMVKLGVLAEWQHGEELNDTVYRVAATIPLNGIQLDPNTFVQCLRGEVGGSRFSESRLEF
jgi:hypothetical protein